MEKYKKTIHEDFTKDIEFINETIKELNLDKNSKILDVGTGIGAMSILLALNGFCVLTGEPEGTLREMIGIIMRIMKSLIGRHGMIGGNQQKHLE